MAKIISVTNRSKFGYTNLKKNRYVGNITKSKKDIVYIHFKWHQMSYRTKLDIDDVAMDIGIDIDIDTKIEFNLNHKFRACNIVKCVN